MKIKLPTKSTVKAQGFEDLISLFYGPPGVGKTTFLNGLFKRILFISTDRGTRNIDAMRVEVFNWKQCLQVLDELEEKGAPHYDAICIDHAADWTNWAEDYTCKKLGVPSLTDKSLPWGKGWREFKKEIRLFMGRVMAMDTAIVFTAHETIKNIKTRGMERDVKMPNLGKSAWDLLIPVIDVIGYCHVGKNDERLVQTEPSEAIYAKDRSLRERENKFGRGPLNAKRFLRTFRHRKTDNEQEIEKGPRAGRRRLRHKGH